MNKIKNLLLVCLTMVLMLSLACGDDDGGGDDPQLTPEEQRLLDLGGSSGITWVATSITQDGAPAAGFDNFTLTVRGTETSKTYNSTDGDPLLNASGTWDFNGTNINQIIFDGDSDNVYSLSGINFTTAPATFTMTVNYTNPGGGTRAGGNGTYVFNMQAQ